MPDIADEIVDSEYAFISHEADVVLACQKGRALALGLSFDDNARAAISIAITEVARNIVKYAGQGEIILRVVRRGKRQGVIVIARDEGPGISDLAQAMRDGYSTGGGLGLGLPGSKRLMDEFEITSTVGKGTIVTMKKWEQARQ